MLKKIFGLLAISLVMFALSTVVMACEADIGCVHSQDRAFCEVAEQIINEYLEREEVVVWVRDTEEANAFIKSPYYRYTFIYEAPIQRMSTWCSVCNNRTAGIFRAIMFSRHRNFRCASGVIGSLAGDILSIYSRYEVYMCTRGCFEMRLTRLEDVRGELRCFAPGGSGPGEEFGDWVILPARFCAFCRNGPWNPHQCWNLVVQPQRDIPCITLQERPPGWGS